MNEGKFKNENDLKYEDNLKYENDIKNDDNLEWNKLSQIYKSNQTKPSKPY